MRGARTGDGQVGARRSVHERQRPKLPKGSAFDDRAARRPTARRRIPLPGPGAGSEQPGPRPLSPCWSLGMPPLPTPRLLMPLPLMPLGRTHRLARGGPHQSSESPRTQASAALHGEFRVVNRDGSAQLRRWQSGAVDAIDSMSLTVRSADGYDSTYLLGPGVSVTGIGVGDEVTVVGAGQAVSGKQPSAEQNAASGSRLFRAQQVALRVSHQQRSLLTGPAAPLGRPASPPRPAHPRRPAPIARRRPSARRSRGWCGTTQIERPAHRTGPSTGW